jgi:hypothetical protein
MMNASLVRCLDVHRDHEHDHDRERQIDHNCSTRTSRELFFSLSLNQLLSALKQVWVS